MSLSSIGDDFSASFWENFLRCRPGVPKQTAAAALLVGEATAAWGPSAIVWD